MKTPTLGRSIAGHDVGIDLERLISSRMLFTANSGGGKSWALRRLLEETHGAVQHLVIDPEGEFYTLRERFDYVLAGRGGDCPADPRSAALLARRLLELGTSAILDLYELAPKERVRFARLFLESLIEAPRNLWHPVLVVIDEAHQFAPEKGHGEAESGDAVASLMSKGRKRAFCGVLATQRLSKLAKDVAAEANNLLVGRASLDVDLRRAGDLLGLPKGEWGRIQSLKAGHFFAYGPAIAERVVEIQTGPVLTSHPIAGHGAAPPPPPRADVQKVLAQLADLPKEAEAEATNLADARKRIGALERELAEARRIRPATVVERVEVPVVPEEMVKRLDGLLTQFAGNAVNLVEITAALQAAVAKAAVRAPAPPPAPKGRAETHKEILARLGVAPKVAPAGIGPGDRSIGKAERRILTALAQYPSGRTKRQVAVLTGYAIGGGGFNNALGSLRSAGRIEGTDHLQATDDGLAALGAYEPLPTGEALLQHWYGQLGKAERQILEALAGVYPGTLTKADLAEAAGYAVGGGGFNNALGRLRTLELASGYDPIRASEDLFS